MNLIENRHQILLGLKKGGKDITEKQKKQKGKCICSGKCGFSCFIKNVDTKSLELTMQKAKNRK